MLFVLNAILFSIKLEGIVNKFLLVGDKFMSEMQERIEKFMQTGNTDFIYRNELDEACFQHDMAYGKTKDLLKKNRIK